LLVSGGTAEVAGLLSAKGAANLGTTAADAINVNGTIDLLGPSTVSNTQTVVAPIVVLGASGGGISSDPSAVLNWAGQVKADRVTVSSPPVIAGDLGVQGANRPAFKTAGGIRRIHLSIAGYVRGHAQVDTLAPAVNVSLTTTAAVGPDVAADMDVTGEAWIQRAIAGDVTIGLIADGLGQIGTNQVVAAPATGGSDWLVVTFSRTNAAASTTPRTYTLDISGGASAVTVKNAKIVALVASQVG